MRTLAPDADDEATRPGSWRSILRLGLMLLALALLVVPFLRGLPLGQTTRTGLLAWLLVGLALYWMFADLGYRPLLLLQLVVFSAAAVLLTTKAGLVLVGIDRLSILRRTARAMILVGAGIAGLNLGALLLESVRRKISPTSADG
jgi:hypothetical protein